MSVPVSKFSFNTTVWYSFSICHVSVGIRKLIMSAITLLSRLESLWKHFANIEAQNSHGISQLRPDDARRPLPQTAEVSGRHSVSYSQLPAPCVQKAACVCCTSRGTFRWNFTPCVNIKQQQQQQHHNTQALHRSLIIFPSIQTSALGRPSGVEGLRYQRPTSLQPDF